MCRTEIQGALRRPFLSQGNRELVATKVFVVAHSFSGLMMNSISRKLDTNVRLWPVFLAMMTGNFGSPVPTTKDCFGSFSAVRDRQKTARSASSCMPIPARSRPSQRWGSSQGWKNIGFKPDAVGFVFTRQTINPETQHRLYVA